MEEKGCSTGSCLGLTNQSGRHFQPISKESSAGASKTSTQERCFKNIKTSTNNNIQTSIQISTSKNKNLTSKLTSQKVTFCCRYFPLGIFQRWREPLGDSTPVTAADFAIQGMVSRALREQRPGRISWLSDLRPRES